MTVQLLSLLASWFTFPGVSENAAQKPSRWEMHSCCSVCARFKCSPSLSLLLSPSRRKATHLFTHSRNAHGEVFGVRHCVAVQWNPLELAEGAIIIHEFLPVLQSGEQRIVCAFPQAAPTRRAPSGSRETGSTVALMCSRGQRDRLRESVRSQLAEPLL